MGGEGPRRAAAKTSAGPIMSLLPDESRTGRESRKKAGNPRRSLRAKARALSRKLLAQTPPLSEAPRPMNSSGRSQTCARVLVASVLFAAFSWTLLVSVSPRLHGCIHGDANRSDHVCAITLIASGSYEHGAQPPVISPPQFDVRFAASAELTSTWVKPLFLSGHIFAHAPPALLKS